MLGLHGAAHSRDGQEAQEWRSSLRGDSGMAREITRGRGWIGKWGDAGYGS